MEASTGQEDDLYNLVVATDVLAEGINLQQCRHIINFDMPWNPMRLAQRLGHIDRIGNPHDSRSGRSLKSQLTEHKLELNPKLVEDNPIVQPV